MDLLENQQENGSNQSKSAMSTASESSIEDLPDEMLDYIFNFLDFVQRMRIELVCKRWRRVGSSPKQLRLEMDYLENCKLVDNILCCILYRRGSSLRKLILKCNTSLTCKSLTKIGEYCPNLESLVLHLEGCDQIACLKLMAPDCPNLKALALETRTTTPLACDADDDLFLLNFYKTYNDICNEGLLAFAENCKDLESLSLSGPTCVSPGCLCVINPNLKTFSVCYTTLTTEGMHSIIKRCHVLQGYTMHCCDLLDYSVLIELLIHFKHTLTVLRLKYQGFDDLDWREVFEVLVSLEVLQLFGCRLVNDDLMEVLADKCVNLYSLDISSTDVTDTGLAALQRLPRLKQLKLRLKTNVTAGPLELLVAKGILEKVFIPSLNVELQEACSKMAVAYPKVCFIAERMTLGKCCGYE